jgi:hypothetical protein
MESERRPETHTELEGQARRGVAAAQNELGRLYERGQGVQRDDGLAVKWYTLAAEQGHEPMPRTTSVAGSPKARVCRGGAVGECPDLTFLPNRCTIAAMKRRRSGCATRIRADKATERACIDHEPRDETSRVSSERTGLEEVFNHVW